MTCWLVNGFTCLCTRTQAREDALHEVQEQGRLLAADAAPHRGSYQPLLASAPPGLDEREHLKWPDHHAVDLRHIDRCLSLVT